MYMCIEPSRDCQHEFVRVLTAIHVAETLSLRPNTRSTHSAKVCSTHKALQRDKSTGATRQSQTNRGEQSEKVARKKGDTDEQT